MTTLANLRRDEGGVATIELALFAPILALMIIGVVDLSNAYGRKLGAEQGAQRAIEKIMQTSGDKTIEDTLKEEAVCQVNGVKADGTCKTAPITTANVTVSYRLDCTNAANFTASTITNSGDTFDTMDCAATMRKARYLEVKVQDKYTPMFPIHFKGLNADGTYHITAIAGMRTS